MALDEIELRTVLEAAKNPSRLAKKRGTISAQLWFYPAVAFAAYTGARRGEVLGMRWSDIDFTSKTISISRSVTEKRQLKAPKNDKSRTISASAGLISILLAHRASQAEERLFLGSAYEDGDFVFALADGSLVDPWSFGMAFRDLIRRVGVTPISLHGLRDTHASLCAKAGTGIDVISRRLGHASISITVERYMYVYNDRDTDAAAAFDGLVG